MAASVRAAATHPAPSAARFRGASPPAEETSYAPPGVVRSRCARIPPRRAERTWSRWRGSVGCPPNHPGGAMYALRADAARWPVGSEGCAGPSRHYGVIIIGRPGGDCPSPHRRRALPDIDIGRNEFSAEVRAPAAGPPGSDARPRSAPARGRSRRRPEFWVDETPDKVFAAIADVRSACRPSALRSWSASTMPPNAWSQVKAQPDSRPTAATPTSPTYIATSWRSPE